MAESKKIVIEVESKGTEKVGQSLADLKKELKSAQSAALNGDGAAAKRVAELKDKMDDLKDSVKTLQGSGVEKAGTSFKLLGEGFANFDFDKIKTGFKGIGTAMKAIPILLIAEGVRYLIENWKELGEGNGIIAKGIQLLNTAFDEITGTISKFTDMIGLTNSELEKQGDAIKTNADKAKEAISDQNAEFDRQIRAAKAAGKSTIELEIAKQQAIIDTNLTIARQIEAFVRAGGELDDEKKKILTASLNAIKDAKITEFEIDQTHTKKLNEEYKKRSDDKEKARIEEGNRIEKGIADEANRRIELVKWEREEKEKEEKALADAKEAQRIANVKADQEVIDLQIAGWKQQDEQAKKLHDAEIQRQNERYQIASNLTSSIGNLSELVFNIRNQHLVKGSAEEEKAAKRQFQIRKSLQLAGAIIDGSKAITSSLASSPLAIGVIPNPVGIASLAAAITNTALAITKIASTQYQSAGGSASAPNISSPSIGGSIPTTSNTQAPTTGLQPFTKLDENGNVNRPVKAYVVETEMTGSQKRVGKLESQASFG